MPITGSGSALAAYLCQGPASDVERLRVLFFDRGEGLLSDEIIASGSAVHVPVPIRAMMARALRLEAFGLILVHNHPSGDARPSMADIEATRRVVEAALPLDILVYDHIITAGSTFSSLRTLGLI